MAREQPAVSRWLFLWRHTMSQNSVIRGMRNMNIGLVNTSVAMVRPDRANVARRGQSR